MTKIALGILLSVSGLFSVASQGNELNKEEWHRELVKEMKRQNADTLAALKQTQDQKIKSELLSVNDHVVEVVMAPYEVDDGLLLSQKNIQKENCGDDEEDFFCLHETKNGEE